MKTCKFCKGKIDDKAKKCKHCSADLRNWFVRHWVITIILVLIIIGSIGNNASQNKNSQSQYKETAKAKEYVDISCPDFSKKFGLSSDLSDLQKDEIFKEYKNKYAKWEGEVSHISDDFGLSMQIKCLSNSLVSDVIISFDDDKKANLLKLKEGDTVEFEGRIRDWGQIMSTSLDDGKIL